MGSWGYHPMDSDGALDLLAEVNDVVNEKLEQMFSEEDSEPSHLYHRVGVAEKLLKDGFFIRTTMVKKCISYLSTCLGDDTWMGSWREPKEARASIEAIKAAMEDLVKDVPDDDTVLAPRGWMCRDFELEPGTSRSGLFEMNTDRPDDKGKDDGEK